MTSRNRGGSSFSTESKSPMPALFTRTSRRPCVFSTNATSDRWSDSLRASAGWPAKRPPSTSPPRRPRAEETLSSERPEMTTASPSRARRLAIANPIPRVPPVTSATRSLLAMVGSYRPSPRPSPRATGEGARPGVFPSALLLSRDEGDAEKSRDGNRPGDRRDPRRGLPLLEPLPVREEDQTSDRASLRRLRPAVSPLDGLPARSRG